MSAAASATSWADLEEQASPELAPSRAAAPPQPRQPLLPPRGENNKQPPQQQQQQQRTLWQPPARSAPPPKWDNRRGPAGQAGTPGEAVKQSDVGNWREAKARALPPSSTPSPVSDQQQGVRQQPRPASFSGPRPSPPPNGGDNALNPGDAGNNADRAGQMQQSLDAGTAAMNGMQLGAGAKRGNGPRGPVQPGPGVKKQGAPAHKAAPVKKPNVVCVTEFVGTGDDLHAVFGEDLEILSIRAAGNKIYVEFANAATCAKAAALNGKDLGDGKVLRAIALPPLGAQKSMPPGAGLQPPQQRGKPGPGRGKPAVSAAAVRAPAPGPAPITAEDIAARQRRGEERLKPKNKVQGVARTNAFAGLDVDSSDDDDEEEES